MATGKKVGRPLGITDFDEQTCAICGRKFVPAPQHVLRDAKKAKFFCSCSCFRKYRREHEARKQKARYRDPEIFFKPLIVDGKEYRQGGYYMKLYSLCSQDLLEARENGLPYIKQGRYYYYNEQDFHDYFSGKIGKDVEG